MDLLPKYTNTVYTVYRYTMYICIYRNSFIALAFLCSRWAVAFFVFSFIPIFSVVVCAFSVLFACGSMFKHHFHKYMFVCSTQVFLIYTNTPSEWTREIERTMNIEQHEKNVFSSFSYSYLSCLVCVWSRDLKFSCTHNRNKHLLRLIFFIFSLLCCCVVAFDTIHKHNLK